MNMRPLKPPSNGGIPVLIQPFSDLGKGPTLASKVGDLFIKKMLVLRESFGV